MPESRNCTACGHHFEPRTPFQTLCGACAAPYEQSASVARSDIEPPGEPQSQVPQRYPFLRALNWLYTAAGVLGLVAGLVLLVGGVPTSHSMARAYVIGYGVGLVGMSLGALALGEAMRALVDAEHNTRAALALLERLARLERQE